MKKIAKSSLVAIFILSTIFSITGCEEPERNADKREKLQAHTTYTLNQQLKKKEQTIAKLETKIANLEEDFEVVKKQANDCITEKGNEFMEIITPMMEETSRLSDENEQLKAKIAELTGEDYQAAPATPALPTMSK